MTSYRIAFVIALVPGLAYAQQPASGQRAPKPASQPTVSVQHKTGAETRGKLVLLDEKSVLILVDGKEQRLSLDRVSRVEQRGDSLKNGAIAGAAVGFFGGLLIGSLGACEPPEGVIVECEDSGRWGPAIGGAIVYGAIGAGIDALIKGRKILYQSPTSALELSPTSVALRVRW